MADVVANKGMGMDIVIIKDSRNSSEVSSAKAINSSEPCSVEIKLQAHFPNDNKQSYDAEMVPFRAQTTNGTIEGNFDKNGEAIIKNCGIGDITFEVYPKIDDEIKKMQEKIKAVLDEIVLDKIKSKNSADKALDDLKGYEWWFEVVHLQLGLGMALNLLARVCLKYLKRLARL